MRRYSTPASFPTAPEVVVFPKNDQQLRPRGGREGWVFLPGKEVWQFIRALVTTIRL